MDTFRRQVWVARDQFGVVISEDEPERDQIGVLKSAGFEVDYPVFCRFCSVRLNVGECRRVEWSDPFREVSDA